MHWFKTCTVFIALTALVTLVGCGPQGNTNPNATPPPKPEQAKAPDFAVESHALTDSSGANKMCAQDPDPTCNARGLGSNGEQMIKACATDGSLQCELFITQQNCDFTSADGVSTCQHEACNSPADCKKNPNPGTLPDGTPYMTPDCNLTNETLNQPDFVGICMYDWSDCASGYGLCQTQGKTVCNAGGCSCSAKPNMGNKLTEACGNGADDDCDGSVDEAASPGEPPPIGCTTQFTDADHDGYGDANASSVCLCGNPVGYSLNNFDCNDLDPNVNPGKTETCNGVDDNCTGGVDEGVKTTYYQDSDGDTYGNPSKTTDSCFPAPAGYVSDNTDCDDTNPNVHPGAAETCNGIDDNCAGGVDENVKTTYYQDSDGDTYGNAGVSTQACSAPVNYVSDNTDCDDTNPNVHPGAAETCNGIDDNCAGGVDENVKTTYYQDGDVDGFGNNLVTTMACSAPAGYVSDNTDCFDGSALIHPGATEVCNGFDDNCDKQIDEGVKTTYYQDADGDTYGNAGVPTQACSAPTGYVANSTDCDDNPAPHMWGGVAGVLGQNVNPGLEELCSTSYDDNCDGDTVHKKDSTTLACDSCANAMKIACNTSVMIDMSKASNTANMIDKYSCWNVLANKSKTLAIAFSAKEVILTPDAPDGTTFNFMVMNGSGVDIWAFLLYGSCEPNSGTSEVTAYNGTTLKNGTCAGATKTSFTPLTPGAPVGTVGQNYVAVDAPSEEIVYGEFSCTAPKP